VPALEIFNNVMTWSDIDKIFVPKISVADGLIHRIYDGLKSKS
ncbi:MAG TPA: exopolyphosphatase, partial [Chryseobacterium sp.]|nr:exopolyphosphatase [Chryseobacterium sp.]